MNNVKFYFLFFRLEAYQRNSDFGRVAVVDAEFSMQTPAPSLYRDINMDSPLPCVSKEVISAYLRAEDAAVKQISKDLYAERYLGFCRWAPGTLNLKSYFIRAQCRAQMKTGVSYIVDVEVDDNGVIMAAQCECAAGMGPDAHCKHVANVLHGTKGA